MRKTVLGALFISGLIFLPTTYAATQFKPEHVSVEKEIKPDRTSSSSIKAGQVQA